MAETANDRSDHAAAEAEIDDSPSQNTDQNRIDYGVDHYEYEGENPVDFENALDLVSEFIEAEVEAADCLSIVVNAAAAITAASRSNKLSSQSSGLFLCI